MTDMLHHDDQSPLFGKHSMPFGMASRLHQVFSYTGADNKPVYTDYADIELMFQKAVMEALTARKTYDPATPPVIDWQAMYNNPIVAPEAIKLAEMKFRQWREAADEEQTDAQKKAAHNLQASLYFQTEKLAGLLNLGPTFHVQEVANGGAVQVTSPDIERN